MPLTDLNLADCLAYRPDLPEPADLDEFWAGTLAEASQGAMAPTFERVDNGLKVIDTYDVTFSGFAGEPVSAWLHLPAGASGPFPGVVEYLGYSGGRGLPHERTLWAQAGYAHLVMDTRGQGWSSAGSTVDVAGSQSTAPGLLTRGIGSPATYYYRRLYTDSVRAAETLRNHGAVDGERVFSAGGSQGGGLSLAVSGLVPWLRGVLADVPFLCNFRRGVEVAGDGPYGEISTYLHTYRDRVAATFETLSYFDAAILVRRATAPSLISIAMMDRICPPSTCFSAYHNYGADKDLRVYEFNDHEGGGAFHQAEQLRWLVAHA